MSKRILIVDDEADIILRYVRYSNQMVSLHIYVI
jgi:hypothetical protein